MRLLTVRNRCRAGAPAGHRRRGRRRYIPFLMSIALPLLAQAHDFYPKDFVQLPCAPANSCRTFPDSELSSAAFNFYGLTLDMKWVLAHRDAILKEFETACRRHASCMAVPGNTYFFCDDVLSGEVRPVCDRLFPGEQQCKNYLEMWLLGVDLHWKEFWAPAQACAKRSPPAAHLKPLEIWMNPEILPASFKGKVTWYALDPDTHLPVFVTFKFEDQIVYAPANPVGLPATGYPFDYSVKFKRVQNAGGHSDIVPPMVTATAEGYPTWQFRLAAEVPQMTVSMSPPAERLRRGKNVVTIEAHDAKSGKPVEARVMFGDDVVGTTNQSITLEVPRGKRPEIWVTSLFNTYSDTVVVKAQ
ncbi:MAG TPA: hypothetical protein VF975_08935 [Thermoanaerobaculia bacterium]